MMRGIHRASITLLIVTGSVLFLTFVVEDGVVTTPPTSNVTPGCDLTIPKDALSHSFKLNSDGSLELFFKLPASSKLAKRFRESKPEAEVNVHYGGDIHNPHIQHITKRTQYPLTLDSVYVINNPKICEGVRKPVLVIVHTAPDHFGRRRAMRETWANIKNIDKGRLRIVFLFGTTTDKQTQTMLENESVVYKDIVQGRFLDSYHNLTHKGVLGYRWVSEHCPDNRMLVKVDDDMFVNIFKIIDEYIPKYENKTRFMSCHVRSKGTSPIVREKSKWKVDKDEFRNMSHYPVTYCNGFFVMMSPSIVREMYRAAYTTPFFWVDDVYLYGLLPHKIGEVEHIHLGPNLTLVQNSGIKCYTGNTTCNLLGATVVSDGVMEKVWFSVIEMFIGLSRKYLPKEIISSLL